VLSDASYEPAEGAPHRSLQAEITRDDFHRLDRPTFSVKARLRS